jgi:regulator of sigma E protease
LTRIRTTGRTQGDHGPRPARAFSFLAIRASAGAGGSDADGYDWPMQGIMPTLLRAFDLALVIGGFSLIIVLHELGHFLAARWAGIRVLAFAVGFGPALVSYRRGLGLRRGSSEMEYRRLGSPRSISATEYRLNALPIFGGYVRMLGQDDADPTARSDEPDSFQRAPVWKRMIVISAGVAMNLLLAAVLFVVVFMAGLRVEPPRVGDVAPGSPAATAVALNADALGVAEVGLLPGDLIVAVDGKRPHAFNDVAMSAIMAGRDARIDLRVVRPGVAEPLRFEVQPRPDPVTRVQQIGIAPDLSNALDADAARLLPAEFTRALERSGLAGVSPSMRVVRAGDQPVERLSDAARAARRSGGRPLDFEFSDGARSVHVTLSPRPQLETTLVERPGRAVAAVQHLLGLLPVMQVDEVLSDLARDAGLRSGDVFVQVGSIEWPSIADGVSQIRAHAGEPIRLAVARREDDRWVLRELGEVRVRPDGTLGIGLAEAARCSARAAAWPAATLTPHPDSPAERGTRIIAVAGEPVDTVADVHRALRRATADAARDGAGAAVPLAIEPAIAVTQGRPRTDTATWTLTPDDVRALHGLGWENPLPAPLFKPDQVLLKADGPLHAIAMGVDRTHSVMLNTYLTFVRLFQGTVKVEQLKGPVGIAHLGTLIAAKGFIWLLFFLGLVSVNLAVINFLPIPIADGGHFVFLVYEQVRGRPPSVAFQNAAAIAGLALIIGLFLVVTVNDIRNLFG